MQKSRIISIITTLIALVFAGGMWIIFSGEKKPEKIVENIQVAVGLKPKILTYEEIISQKQQIITKEVEILTRANTSHNPEFCNGLTSTGSQIECKDNVFQSIALIKKDSHICTEVSSGAAKETCENNIVFATAITDKDFSRCANISDSFLKRECENRGSQEKLITILSGTGLNTDSCKTLSGSSRDICQQEVRNKSDRELYQEAVRTSKREVCTRIQNTRLSDGCNDTVLLAQVRTVTDDNLCRLMKSDARQIACQERINSLRDIMLYNSALSYSDTTLCSTINNGDTRTLCQDALALKKAVQTKNSTLCTSIKSDSSRNQCLKETSIK